VLSNTLHHFPVKIVPKSCICFALGKRGSKQGRRTPCLEIPGYSRRHHWK